MIFIISLVSRFYHWIQRKRSNNSIIIEMTGIIIHFRNFWEKNDFRQSWFTASVLGFFGKLGNNVCINYHVCDSQKMMVRIPESLEWYFHWIIRCLPIKFVYVYNLCLEFLNRIFFCNCILSIIQRLAW